MSKLKKGMLFFGYIFVALLCSCDNEPYEGILTVESQPSCAEVSDVVDIALNNYLDSDSNNFEQNCLAYNAALEEQLVACPESSDQILEQISDLNNCEFNSFFQVDFDNDTFLSLSAEAHMSKDQLTITGRRDNEEFKLILYQTTQGAYQFGSTDTEGNINTASYFPDTTSNESWVSVSDGNETMGQVTVSEIDYSNLRISGTFSFTGLNNNETKHFTNGIFMNIPLTKDNDFFALYDGEEYVESFILNFFFQEESRIVIIVFSELENLNMDFVIDANTTPGSYNFQLFPFLPTAGFTNNPDFYYNANGNLTITAHNTEANFIMGTFEFIAELDIASPDSYTITEGRFCVNYGI